MKLKGKTQLTIQVPDDQVDDIRLVSSRRGQTVSEFIRRAVDEELERDADSAIED